MECLYWLKMSSDGRRSLLVRAEGDLRTVTHSSLLPLLSVPLRDYSPVLPVAKPLLPATLYKWDKEQDE